MIYTSGIWHTEDDTLEQAQINKMELIAQKIHLKQGDKHLDLGCGWGTFINYCQWDMTANTDRALSQPSFEAVY
jgi:cyclopropane fatty-acyl-phospholipid synthase-like methyltransferase